MTEDNEDQPRLPIWRWTFLLTALILAALGVDQGLRWSGFWNGFESMIFILAFTVVPLLIIFAAALLWNAIWLRIFNKRGGRGWLKLIIISPAIGLVTSSVLTQPTSPERFEQITNVTFPETYSESRFHHYGGGLADHSHTFVFTTTPEETQRLIRELELSQKDSFSNQNFEKLLQKYPGGTIYHRAVDDRNWYYDLITDETQTKVWINLWGI